MTPGELKIEEMRDLIDMMSVNFKKSKQSLQEIKTIINYRPKDDLIMREDESDDESNDYIKFLHGLNKVKSKICHIWKAPQG